jgi:hypothetical protein
MASIWFILVKGLMILIGAAAIASLCLYFIFRKIKIAQFVPRQIVGIVGVLIGVLQSVLMILVEGRGGSPLLVFFMVLFFILIPASGFLTAWEWRWRAIAWPFTLAFLNSIAAPYFHPKTFIGSGSTTIAFLLVLTNCLTGFLFCTLSTRRGVVPNETLLPPHASAESNSAGGRV